MIYDNSTSRQAMRRSLLWVCFAILLTLGVGFIANLFSSTAVVKNWRVSGLQFDAAVEAPSEVGEADTAAEVGLRVEIPEQNEMLSYSSQAEIFRFTLDADGPYTLRYLTLSIHSEGLKTHDEWTIYPVEEEGLVGERIDFQNPVAVSEKSREDWVRFRFFSSVSSAYVGAEGGRDFVVVGQVIKNPTDPRFPLLNVGFPHDLAPEWDWAWLPGEHQEAWLQVAESLGVNALADLPDTVVRLR